MKKGLLSVLVLGLSSLLIAGCMNKPVEPEEVVDEEEVVEVVEPEVEEVVEPVVEEAAEEVEEVAEEVVEEVVAEEAAE
jgi:PBP1b-binding outer membrane lipoprotein LpoB